MFLAVATVLLATLAAVPADVKGRWEGTVTAVRDDGTKQEQTALLLLEQKDSTISGTVGGGESDQHTITSGTIDGSKVVIVATPANGPEVRLELTVEGEEMKGMASRGTRTAQVVVKRVKG